MIRCPHVPVHVPENFVDLSVPSFAVLVGLQNASDFFQMGKDSRVCRRFFQVGAKIVELCLHRARPLDPRRLLSSEKGRQPLHS